jgi:pyrrolidone-carboxylate peptidase
MMETWEERLDHTPLDFGKHAGKTPEQIAEIDPSYIVWLGETFDGPQAVSAALVRACQQDLREMDAEGDLDHWDDYPGDY